MVSPFHGRRMSPAEYLAMERASDVKHELVDGVVREVGVPLVIAPARGSEVFLHALLVSRVLQGLGPGLRVRGLDAVGGGVRLGTEPTDESVVPDVVICGAPRFDDEQRDVLLNPTAVVEVLSPSTEARDRGKKAQVYRGIASLQMLVFVSQAEPRVEWFERAGEFWVLHEAVGIESVAALQALEARLPMAELYDGIDFDAANAGQEL